MWFPRSVDHSSSSSGDGFGSGLLGLVAGARFGCGREFLAIYPVSVQGVLFRPALSILSDAIDHDFTGMLRANLGPSIL